MPLHAKIVIVLVVLISMTTTYLTVRQSMKRGMMPTGKDSPMGQSQKLMAYIMPLFALTGLYWQFGLVLYWVTTNLWTLGQQYVLLRKYPVGAAAMGPDGNMPIGGKAGKPATASGLTGRTKPVAGVGQEPGPGRARRGPAVGRQDRDRWPGREVERFEQLRRCRRQEPLPGARAAAAEQGQRRQARDQGPRSGVRQLRQEARAAWAASEGLVGR